MDASNLLHLTGFLFGAGSAPASPDHTITVAVITVFGGGAFALITALVTTRGGRRARGVDPGVPNLQDAYLSATQRLLELERRLDALTVFLAERGYRRVDAIVTGREPDELIRG